MTVIKTETEIKEVVETPEVVRTIKENHEALKATIEALNIDYEKFNEKKVKAAGARVRNNLLNCKKLCDKLRKQVLADIKAIPIKHRKSSDDEEESKDYDNPPPSKDDIPEPLELKRETPVKEKKVRKPRKANKPKVKKEPNALT